MSNIFDEGAYSNLPHIFWTIQEIHSSVAFIEKLYSLLRFMPFSGTTCSRHSIIFVKYYCKSK